MGTELTDKRIQAKDFFFADTMSYQTTSKTILIVIAAVVLLVGCQFPQREKSRIRFADTRTSFNPNPDHNEVVSLPTEVHHVNFDQPLSENHFSAATEFYLPPLTSADDLPEQIPLHLDDLLHLALTDTAILRNLGAQILVNPAVAEGSFAPAIVATDSNYGIEAALSQFDANLSAGLNHANNDNVFNNSILGGGATEVVQDYTTANVRLNKVAANGAQFSFGKNLIYDSNNNPTSTFPSSYATVWEATARQPLLQGRGVEFNRIAGPNAQPGFRSSNGVIISQINHDASIVKFELGVREFVNDIVSAYWELHFAYKNFEASKTARDAAHETWQTVKSKFDNDLPGGEADKEAQAREQYFLFQQQLVTALNGDPRVQTTGVLQAESNLRRLLGLPQNDGRLIRPADSPDSVKTVYDWNAILDQSLATRVELKQQSYQVKKREMELLASKNFLLPRLDAVATVRNNGFGDDLIGGGGRFSSAFSDSVSGDHNEWEMGLQMNVPIGFRQASAGVRNYELKLLHERAILGEQRKQIAHDLGTSIRLTEQYHTAMQYAYNRMLAAGDMQHARAAAFAADAVSLDLLLEAQRRLADAESDFHRAHVNYHLSNERVNRESGSLLASHWITLNPANAIGFTAVCHPTGVGAGGIDYRY